MNWKGIYETTCKKCGKKEEEVHFNPNLPRFISVKGFCISCHSANKNLREEKAEKERKLKQARREELEEILAEHDKELFKESKAICRNCFFQLNKKNQKLNNFLNGEEPETYFFGLFKAGVNYYFSRKEVNKSKCPNCLIKEVLNNFEREQAESNRKIDQLLGEMVNNLNASDASIRKRKAKKFREIHESNLKDLAKLQDNQNESDRLFEQFMESLNERKEYLSRLSTQEIHPPSSTSLFTNWLFWAIWGGTALILGASLAYYWEITQRLKKVIARKIGKKELAKIEKEIAQEISQGAKPKSR